MIKILAITDIHHGKSFETKRSCSALDILDRFVEYANVSQPDFVVDLGDRINDVDQETDYRLMGEVAEKFNQIAVRREHILGNHDVAFLTNEDNETLLNATVRSRSFILDDWHFIFWSPDTRYSTQSGFPEDDKAVEWLEVALDQHSGPTILFCHVPQVTGNLDGNYWFENNPWAAVLPYNKRVLNILADHPGIQMTVGGHIHWPRLNTLNGIHHITLPSIIEGFFSAGTACALWTEISISDTLTINITGSQNWEWKLPLREYGHKWPAPRKSSRQTAS